MDSPFAYFTDAVLRGPTLGSMLMCVAASLVGVVVYLRRESLVGESLSHAAYPGVILGVLVVAGLIGDQAREEVVVVAVMGGAFITAFLGLWLIAFLERRLRVRSDAALCFVLSIFFGWGLTMASRLQFTHAALFRKGQAYLLGQVATMTDSNVAVYAVLALLTILVLALFCKEIEIIIFDPELAVTLGLPVRIINALVFSLIVLAVVVGLRSVGVVLMAAMLIAPAATARQFTQRFSYMLAWAGLFGLLSGFLGNYLSVELTRIAVEKYAVGRFVLPTGPMIVLVAGLLCFGALLFAPERGYIPRLVRRSRFRHRCLKENLLKSLWRFGPQVEVSFGQLARFQTGSTFYLWMMLQSLVFSGWVERVASDLYRLTCDGRHRAARIVRLHRLWEVYLVDYLGVGVERVHRNAEEIEHILTPELEEQLVKLLRDPDRDPHHQPIPRPEIAP